MITISIASRTGEQDFNKVHIFTKKKRKNSSSPTILYFTGYLTFIPDMFEYNTPGYRIKKFSMFYPLKA